MVFRQLQSNIERIKASSDPKDKIDDAALTAVKFLDANKDKLKARNPPVDNTDDVEGVAVASSEQRTSRSEVAVSNLRQELLAIIALEADDVSLSEKVRSFQQRALQYLSDVGELLIPSFPYTRYLPTTSEYDLLPKLEGRCRVSFQVFTPSGTLKGNVTILADGYTASVTAGEFVDLSRRGFYEGLDVKEVKKRIVSRNTVDKSEERSLESFPFFKLSLDVLGAFNSGFIDPCVRAKRLTRERSD